MKKYRILLVALLVIAFAVAMVGCYFVDSQKMDKVKGTYKLVNYTYVPSYERKEGYTPNRRDYINDEKYLYEDYLIVTGTSTGYYIHKDASGEAYVKEVTLSYEYDAEDSSKVEYVTYYDALNVGSTTNNGNHLGVSKGGLNFSRPAFDYTQLFTGKKMRSEDLDVNWEKVDKATDLSYVKKQIPSLKEYDFKGYGVRGIYELGNPTKIEAENEEDNVPESPYLYCFYVIDTAKGVTTATVCYAMKETPTEQVTKSVSFSADSSWSTMTINSVLWTVDPTWGNYYYSESDGLKYQLTCRSNDISDSMLESLISSYIPVVVE